MNHQRIESIAGRVQKILESSKNQVYCKKSSENTWVIKESSLLQEEFRKNLNRQRINSIARVQKKLESSKNQFYCKSSEKTWIIEESIQNKPQETHQSSEEKKKKKEKTRQQEEEEDDDEGMQV